MSKKQTPEKKKEKLLNNALMEELEVDKNELKQLKKKLLKAEGYPERGIETWFRLTSKNLYTRRQIVDTKGSILITINSIIISVILGSFYNQLGEDPHLVYAVGPMILTNLLSIAFAVFATKPKIRTSTFSKEDVQNGTAQLMTFDNFYTMSEKDYSWAISEMMSNRYFLYQTIKKDIYFLGIDLVKRYRYIQTAYSIFLIGLTISLLSFTLCHAMF